MFTLAPLTLRALAPLLDNLLAIARSRRSLAPCEAALELLEAAASTTGGRHAPGCLDELYVRVQLTVLVLDDNPDRAALRVAAILQVCALSHAAAVAAFAAAEEQVLRVAGQAEAEQQSQPQLVLLLVGLITQLSQLLGQRRRHRAARKIQLWYCFVKFVQLGRATLTLQRRVRGWLSRRRQQTRGVVVRRRILFDDKTGGLRLVEWRTGGN